MSDQAPSWLPDAHPTFPGEDAFGVDELIDRIVGELEGPKPPFAIGASASMTAGAWASM
ncbi:MAG: hypothetical protein M3473_07185 [Chloroflexota bacterium]|jgi:hypothetical protein|nr:hypothetical protein [Chloroflexota bacterium]